MPLKKIVFKPGVNRENTRYTTEGGWYESEKVRFRQGTPEKIGGWFPVSIQTFLGVCRSLWNFVTLAGLNLLGIGTNLKYYIENGGQYYDITPIVVTNTFNNVFATGYTTLVGNVTAAANTIQLANVTYFPQNSGLVKIDTEQIFYKIGRAHV